MNHNQQIAETIIQQMGLTQGKIRAMVSGQCLAIQNGLQVNFKGSRKANKLQIILMADDTYTVRFFKYNRRTFDCPMVEEWEGMYWDMLKENIERFTGLYWSL